MRFSVLAASITTVAVAQQQNGVVPLPQGGPVTTQQHPVPKPALPMPASDRPLRASPSIEQIAAFAQSRPITIDDAVAIALYTNRALATSIASLQAAQARTGQARAQLSPTLGVNSQLTYFDRGTSFDVSALNPTAPPGTSFTIVPQFNPVNTAAFTLPIDISGALHSAVSQAQFAEIASRIDVNRVRNQIVGDVKNAFYAALRAQAQTVVATENVNEALSRLSDAQKNYAAGTAPYFDVLSAQRDVAQAQQGLITANNQVSIALANLKNTIGLSVGTNLSLSSATAVDYPPGVSAPPALNLSDTSQIAPKQSEEPRTAPESTYKPLLSPRTDVVQDPTAYGPEFKALIDEALSTRPEVLEAEAQVTAAERGILFARRSSLPSLALSLDYTNTPNAAGFSRKNQGAASLGINFPIFDGGLGREREREARANVASAQISWRQAEDLVQLDVQQAYLSLVQARDRVAVANVQLAQAEESYRVARLRYNAGVSQQITTSPQLELSTAQASLTQAQTDQVNALYDYNNARAQLDRAVGRYSYVGSGPGYAAPPKLPSSH